VKSLRAIDHLLTKGMLSNAFVSKKKQYLPSWFPLQYLPGVVTKSFATSCGGGLKIGLSLNQALDVFAKEKSHFLETHFDEEKGKTPVAGNNNIYQKLALLQLQRCSRLSQ
jgi:hypothetical protein